MRIEHSLDLLTILEEVLPEAAFERLKKGESKGLFSYELDCQKVPHSDEINISPIDADDLTKCLNQLQTEAKFFESSILIEAAGAIWKESVEFANSLDANNRAWYAWREMAQDSA